MRTTPRVGSGPLAANGVQLRTPAGSDRSVKSRSLAKRGIICKALNWKWSPNPRRPRYQVIAHAHWTQSWLFCDRSSEPRRIEPHLRGLRAVRALLTRLDSLAGNLGPFVRATPVGLLHRSLLLAHSIAERVDNRCVPSGLGRDWCAPHPFQTAQHWR